MPPGGLALGVLRHLLGQLRAGQQRHEHAFAVGVLLGPVARGPDRQGGVLLAVAVGRLPSRRRVGSVPVTGHGDAQGAGVVGDRPLGRGELALGGVPGSPADGEGEQPDQRQHREPPAPATRQGRLGQLARVGLHGGPRTGLGQLGVAVEPRLGRRTGGDRAEGRFQRVDELGDGRVAVVAAAGQPAVQHLLDGRGERPLRRRDGRQRARVHRVGQREVRERRPAGEQQEGQGGQRVLVGARIRRLGGRLLRRHVGRGASDHREPRGHVEGLAQAEVADHRADAVSLGTVDAAEQDVGGLDVAVQDVAVVQRLEPGADLADHLHGLRRRQPLDVEAVGEGALVGVRHHQVGTPVVELTRVVDRDHVRRLDLAQVAALLEEPLPDLVVLGPVVGEHLDRHRRVELLVVGQPHRREATGADPAAHGVPAEPVGHGHAHILAPQATDETIRA